MNFLELKNQLLDIFEKKLNKLFDKYHVTTLFVSHIHGYFKGTWSQTPYIIT